METESLCPHKYVPRACPNLECRERAARDEHFHQAGKGCCPHPDCVRATAPSGSLSIQQQESFRLELRKLAAENETLRSEVRLHRQKREGEYWAWQGDEDDHPESLTCPVLVPADTVRGWLAVQARIEQLLYEMSLEGYDLNRKGSDAVYALEHLMEIVKPKDHGRGPGGA